MSRHKLVAPADAAKDIARLLSAESTVVLEVQEDKCFASGAFWRLGELRVSGDRDDPQDIYLSTLKGYYDLHVVTSDEARSELIKLLAIVEPGVGADKKAKEAHAKSLSRIDRILDAVAANAIRVGLGHPIFDASSVEEMPFQCSTTVVADTSAILQGGLDFVARFLYPAIRVKIPAIAHMEIVNIADGFFKKRRAGKANKTALLFDHILSQSGQRALLRLELRAETEVERTLLIGDPLRNAFQRDTDPEWSDLNLSVPLRSYCDRLIIEAARQHQAHATPGHSIQLLTSDQGFARMALAEGILPLYFRAIVADGFFGRLFTGTAFNPFSGTLYRVPLAAILWEFATAFGVARLASKDGRRWVEVTAIGEGLSWSPVHSRDDLLWLRSEGLPQFEIREVEEVAAPAKALAAEPRIPSVELTVSKKKKSQPKKVGAVTKRAKTDASGFYRLSIERLFQLLTLLSARARLTEGEAFRVAGVERAASFNEFRRLLVAGDLAIWDGAGWAATESGLSLGAAIRNMDIDAVSAGLRAVPSIGVLLGRLETAQAGSPIELEVPERAEPTYRTLSEVLCAGAGIPGEGFYPTPSRPATERFVEAAMRRFSELDLGDGLVSVGSWLEALVRNDGIHPERARRLLDEAVAAGAIIRSTEGSTTDTRHDQHNVRVLRQDGGLPHVRTVHLYRGDFLVPNKSSSSLRLTRPKS